LGKGKIERHMEAAVLYNVPHEVPWKIYIPLYFYFTGLSAGSFILSTLSTVFGIKRFKPMAFVVGSGMFDPRPASALEVLAYAGSGIF
jgi:Ni/Fe-hydrogenase subunit HybB-like protein